MNLQLGALVAADLPRDIYGFALRIGYVGSAFASITPDLPTIIVGHYPMCISTHFHHLLS